MAAAADAAAVDGIEICVGVAAAPAAADDDDEEDDDDDGNEVSDLALAANRSAPRRRSASSVAAIVRCFARIASALAAASCDAVCGEGSLLAVSWIRLERRRDSSSAATRWLSSPDDSCGVLSAASSIALAAPATGFVCEDEVEEAPNDEVTRSSFLAVNFNQ